MLKTTDFRKKPKLRKAWVSFILPECTARLIFSGKKSIFFQPAHKGGNVLPRRCLIRIVFRQQRRNQCGFVGLGLQPLPEERAGIVQRDHHIQLIPAGQCHHLARHLPQQEPLFDLHLNHPFSPLPYRASAGLSMQ